MAITNGYTTLARLKGELATAIESFDTSEDARLERAIEAVSRWIDQHCDRRFYAVTETRYFTAEDTDWLRVPDLLSVTTIATDDGARTYATSWSATDYDLDPPNAAADGRPYTSISLAPNGTRSFPVGIRRGVRIAGSWGYCSASPGNAGFPADVERACMLQAIRIYKRMEAPFGVLGAGEAGTATVLPRLDPDVKMLLANYQRGGLVVGAV